MVLDINCVCERICETESNSISKTKTIVCALWFLATIKIPCENMDSKSVENVMNDCVIVSHPVAVCYGRSGARLLWLNVECVLLCARVCVRISIFDKVSKLHINMMPVHLLMYDNQLIIIFSGETQPVETAKKIPQPTTLFSINWQCSENVRWKISHTHNLFFVQ